MVTKTEACKIVNLMIEDELKAISEYGEIIDAFTDECPEFIDDLERSMEDEARHAIRFRNMGIILGCKEPVLQDREQKMLKMIDDMDLD